MKHRENNFEIVVIGGGHAGIEAAIATAKLGRKTLLVTMSVQSIGRMSCNPAIGGTAKGQLVREIDALGGVMGRIADASGIHFRMLNTSKGPAVWSPRSQNDRELYAVKAQEFILSQENLFVIEDIIEEILVVEKLGKKQISGAIAKESGRIDCRSVVVCTGTFMSSLMHTGITNKPGGRFDEPTSSGISYSLQQFGLKHGRLKTGTPPRIDIYSIDFSKVEEQNGGGIPQPFSFSTEKIANRQIPMYLTHTNKKTHEILRTGFHLSPMFTGVIKGIGPRYCPSIEDKVSRFAEKNTHHLFLEPEGYNTSTVYVNGFSTSLSREIQEKALKTVDGLEKVNILRSGYAVEYDYFPSHQLKLSLETKLVDGLFNAGQINGTSGYEEAAAQGLIAGINAAMYVQNKEPLILKRSEAYIGVLIDDLVNLLIDEPYRMFTSRAEYRLLLRQDNADRRLTETGYKLGLATEKAKQRLNKKEEFIAKLRYFVLEKSIAPEEVNEYLKTRSEMPITQKELIGKLVKRSNVKLNELLSLLCHPERSEESIAVFKEDASFAEFMLNEVNVILRSDERKTRLEKEAIEQVEIELKYDGYISRQNSDIEKFEKTESSTIPIEFDYSKVKSLSAEGREKLGRIKPQTLGQASRISGVTPADVSVLMVYLHR